MTGTHHLLHGMIILDLYNLYRPFKAFLPFNVILEGDELAQVTTTSPCGAALWKVWEIC